MSGKKKNLGTIPKPDGLPVLGNALSVDANEPIQSLMRLAEGYDGIFWLDFFGSPYVVIHGVDLAAEVFDESRFGKVVRGPLKQIRAVGGDGLFTADSDDENWRKAHNILMPPFSQRSMNAYLPQMTDVARQLVTKWERMNRDDEIDVPRDMIGLTLDTIGLCGFDYRFNSFYRDGFHPFIDSLTRSLETIKSKRGMPLENFKLREQINKLNEDVEAMNSLVDSIIEERRNSSDQNNDLLTYMLSGEDRKTGEGLSSENIRYQINTFLIAGHETTSGLLSFTLYYLLENPDVLEKAYEEVDQVLGPTVDAAPTIAQINELKYVRALLLEALRLWPTAPSFAVAPFKDEIIGGRYELPKGTFVSILVPSLHRDKKHWGENPETFNPENFSKEAEAARHPDAFKPFGNGKRACIGRQFAIQEAILVIGLILQRFEIFNHRNYKLKIKETLSLKPDDFKMKVKLRKGIVRGVTDDKVDVQGEETPPDIVQYPKHGTPLTVLFGSNLGETESFSRNIAQSGELYGFDVKMAPLDDYATHISAGGPIVFASASYNGSPPDNAIGFMEWLRQAKPEDVKGLHYTVLGCGNSDWAATFQAVPREIDETLERLGAVKFTKSAELDAKIDIDTQFSEWEKHFWEDLATNRGLNIDFSRSSSSQPLYSVEVVDTISDHPIANALGAEELKVLENRELITSSNGRSTRHITFELPTGVSFEPGDHLCIVPKNRPQIVERVLKQFGLNERSYIRVDSRSEMRGPFPSGSVFSIKELAENAGELQAVATRRDISIMARYTPCPVTAAKLLALSEPPSSKGEPNLFIEEIANKRKSLLDLLEEFPACELPLAIFLEIIPMMVPRYYSISSSPKHASGRCSITVSVVRGPALSGNGTFEGTCSNQLLESQPGDILYGLIKTPSTKFRLPEDPQTPVIMIGPGTGLAPFRAFLQDRQIQSMAGKKLGPAMLFFGCRHPGEDFYYRDELEAFEDDGLVSLHVAFSRLEKEKVYVQNLIEGEGDRIWELIESGAKIYVCGDGARMEPDVYAALINLFVHKTGQSKADGLKWIEGLKNEERYLLDVWAG